MIGRRLVSGRVAAVVVPLLMLFMASGSVSAEQVSPNTNGIVPDVLFWDVSPAVAAVQAAGFVARTAGGFVDCGPPYVQSETPGAGTSAPLGSTVTLKVNRQPGP